MWKVVAIGVGVLSLHGCSPTIRPVASVLAQIKRDEVAAAATMQDHDIGLEGRVNHKGLRTEREFVIKFGWQTGQANEVKKNLGYIELGSNPGSEHALCLFEPAAFDWLATVREGQTVKLACRFANLDGVPPDRYPVFRNCWVQY